MKTCFLYQTIFYLAGTSILMPDNALCNEKTKARIDTKLPNILVILADDQGYADVSYHEHPKEVSTPAIDQLAKTGIVQ